MLASQKKDDTIKIIKVVSLEEQDSHKTLFFFCNDRGMDIRSDGAEKKERKNRHRTVRKSGRGRPKEKERDREIEINRERERERERETDTERKRERERETERC